MNQDIEGYYSSALEGGLACICHIDPVLGEQFVFTRITRTADNKITTAYGVFWSINGERCDRRWRGEANQLVVPTLSRLVAEETRMSSVYQFGIDRKFEFAVARAILENRLKEMPQIPPPPIPTLDEAKKELDAAMAYWLSIDSSNISPGNSLRVHRVASERLADAKRNYICAKKSTSESDIGRIRVIDQSHASSQDLKLEIEAMVIGYGQKFKISTGKLVKTNRNDFDASVYTVSTSFLSYASTSKRDT